MHHIHTCAERFSINFITVLDNPRVLITSNIRQAGEHPKITHTIAISVHRTTLYEEFCSLCTFHLSKKYNTFLYPNHTTR